MGVVCSKKAKKLTLDPYNPSVQKQAQKYVQVSTSTKTAASRADDSPLIPPKMLACCSGNNKISIVDLKTKQDRISFDGAQLPIMEDVLGWSHLKEIPNTQLLVSLQNKFRHSAKLEIFNISKKGRVNKIYSFEEVLGVTGFGDLAYNSRRNYLGAISLEKKTAYHLFGIDSNNSNYNDIVTLNRKSKWHSQYNNHVTGLDLNPIGEYVATIDIYGTCLISDLNKNSYGFHINMKMGSEPDCFGRCRWSPHPGEAFIYVKHYWNKLNILDVEKQALTLTNSIRLEIAGDLNSTNWIDVCQSNGNLLASGGMDKNINIFDKRESKIVKTFYIHSDHVNCVKWSSSGDMLASASLDKSTKLLDFKTGKTIHTVKTFGEINSFNLLLILITYQKTRSGQSVSYRCPSEKKERSFRS